MPLAQASAIFFASFARIPDSFNGDEARHALAFGVLAADGMAGTLRRDHDDVHILRRNNGLEMDRKAV